MKVWPNHTVFIDWFSPNATNVWFKGLNDLYNLIPYDGLWIDMNEATGFCSGECILSDSDSETKVKQLLS
jgi:alpha-glucosidase (family GH31 glycosyl hydrolase)